MSSQKPTCETLGRTAPQCSHSEPKTLGVFLKVAAAVLGIACHFGSAYAQVQSPGATAPGVPTTPYARPDDSTTGVTQATPANRAMTCQTGYVVSGGQCVALTTLIPPTPECAYGQVRSGGQCIALPPTQPAQINCPSGQVLSGGVCVPMQSNPTPTCATQPELTQYIPCPSGQTGSIVQTRSGTCNATTSYTWSMTGWSTTSNSCSAAPAQPSCPAQPATSQSTSCPSGQTGVVYQARSATCNASTGFTWSMGAWFTSSNSCSVSPPASCSALSGTDTWGSCTFTGSVPTTAAGGIHTNVNQTPGFTGTRIHRCDSGPANWSVVSSTCQATAPTTVQCPAAPPATQSLACPAGQTGSITQARSMSCNTSNGTWTLGSWYQSGSTCVTPPPAACDAGSTSLNWGAGCSYNGHVTQTAVGATITLRNQNPAFTTNSSQTYRCNSGPGGWALVLQDCQALPAPPAPAGCPSVLQQSPADSGGTCHWTLAPGQHSQTQSLWLAAGMQVYSPRNVQCLNGSWIIITQGNCYFEQS